MITLNDVGADFIEILIAHFDLAVLGDGLVDAPEEILNLRLLVYVHHFIYLYFS